MLQDNYTEESEKNKQIHLLNDDKKTSNSADSSQQIKKTSEKNKQIHSLKKTDFQPRINRADRPKPPTEKVASDLDLYVKHMSKYFTVVHNADENGNTERLVVMKIFDNVAKYNKVHFLDKNSLKDLLDKWPPVLQPVVTYNVKKEKEVKSYKPANIVDVWLKSAKVKEYFGIAFDPLNTNKDKYNLWTECPCVPKRNDALIQPYLDHIFDVICNESEVDNDYWWNFLAHMIQHPEELPAVGIAIVSPQGTGKGLALKPFSYILGGGYYHATRPILGRFNRLIMHRRLIFVDEAYHGSKEDTDKMKTLITESEMEIEMKFKDPIKVENRCRYIFSSNHDYFAAIDESERRYHILRIPLNKKKHPEYFESLAELVENPEFHQALLYYLMNRDLTNFDVRDYPKNDELFEQKIRSLNHQSLFWLQTLARWVQNGELIESNMFINKIIDYRFQQWISTQPKDKKRHDVSDRLSYTANYLIRSRGYFKWYKDTSIQKPEKRKQSRWGKSKGHWVQINNCDKKYKEPITDIECQGLLCELIHKTAENMGTDGKTLFEYLKTCPAIDDDQVWKDAKPPTSDFID